MVVRTPARQRTLPRPPREPVLAALLELLGKPVFRAAAADREDAVMEAILRVLQWEEDSAPRSVEEALARRYASRAVQNILIDRFRHQLAASLPRVDPASLAADTIPETQAAHPLQRLAAGLLNELPETQADLLRAYFAGTDYFHDELALQALTPGAARVRIHRLLRRLRKRGHLLLSQSSG